MRLVRENDRENGGRVFTNRENGAAFRPFWAHRAGQVCAHRASVQAPFSRTVKTKGPFSRKNGGVFTSKIVQVPDVIDARENVKKKRGSKRLKEISRAFWGGVFCIC